MKIVFAGTPEFAVKPLAEIVAGGFSVVGVITQEEFDQKKRQLLDLPPVERWARCSVCGCDDLPTKRIDVQIAGDPQNWVMCDRCADAYRKRTRQVCPDPALKNGMPDWSATV